MFLLPKAHSQSSPVWFSLFASLVVGIVMTLPQAGASTVPTKDYSMLHWRLVGPFRGGWATMAAGVPGKPNTFYFGSAGGGVWKTVDAGRTWHPLMNHEQSAAVGALAVSRSNPNIIYVGTGQVAFRYDTIAGNGIYRSTNGGKTWDNVGLDKTRHIGRILVDPKNPDIVLVAAFGHVFGPNRQRGVYRSTNGGKTWHRVLYVNDTTGAVDLAWDPKNTKVVYAAMWQAHMHPWLDYFQSTDGEESGIYKSTDGGRTWHRLSGHGLPTQPMGRVGLAVASGTGGRVVYASIATSQHPGLYRSTDGGRDWRYVNHNSALASSYFGRLVVSPDNPQVVYVMGRSIRRSTDGGKHFKIIKGAPGGDDYHFLWINPDHPSHMITAADQGAAVTVDGGKSWSSWYNQPTGQFYHVAADNRFPFWIYSGQQDSGTVGIASRSNYGVISERNWHPVGGDERDYDVPKPGDPNIVFGSGLGGHVSRYDNITGQVRNVSPWPVGSYGANPTKVRYRYTWITPLVFSPLEPHTLYFGAQYLFASNDGGSVWHKVSPDLTGATPGTQGCTNPGLRKAKACGFGVIYSIAPSPAKKGLIWVGTDDGLIQRTTDGGKIWRNVTPASVPLWARIDAISPSPSNPQVAYVAVDPHRLAHFRPLILVTHDGGRHWKRITTGLPDDEYVNVVRVDPKQPNLLFAGTNRGVYVSFDQGQHWQPLSFNLPTVPVRDLLVHDNDLIAATQGRAIWVMDDLAPLRQLAARALRPGQAKLFKPAVAVRLRPDENRDTPPPPSTPLGQNPPTGAIIDYWLPSRLKGPVTLTIRDSKGTVVRHFSSAAPVPNLPADRYFQRGWLGHGATLSSRPGAHRFIWNLRYARPPALQYHYSIAGVWHRGTSLLPQGPLVLPGRYKVTLKVTGQYYSHMLTVRMDPRVHVKRAALQQQLTFENRIESGLAQAVAGYHTALRVHAHAQASHFKKITGILAALLTKVESADAAPTRGQRQVFAIYNERLSKRLKQMGVQQGRSAAGG